MSFLVCAVLAAAVGTDAAPAVNPLLEGLIGEGVRMSDGSSVRLPEPAMVERLDGRDQAALLAKVAVGGQPVSELVRKSVFAPFVLKVGPIAKPGEEGPPGWTLDVWFVAYGDWDAVNSRDFLESLVTQPGRRRAAGEAAWIEPLGPESLAERQIQLVSGPGREDGYYRIPATLFDRVELTATWQVVVTRSPESVVVAAKIDSRFDQDREFPNQWRRLVRDPGDPTKLNPGPTRVYAQGGFYGKMTRLAEPAGAILVECHGVFEEPEAWFDGAPLLRSKLPMVVQEQVRTFRGKLAKSR